MPLLTMTDDVAKVISSGEEEDSSGNNLLTLKAKWLLVTMTLLT